MRINPRLKDDLKKFLIEKIRSEKNAVKVISSYNLSDVEKKLLKSKFPKLDWLSAKFNVDPEIIAGVVITIGSQIIDLSLKGHLSNLQHTIYESD